MINEVINGLPLYFQKENNIKIYKTLEPVILYLDELIENLKGQTSLKKASGIFLDFLGARYEEKRKGRNDELYRQALILKRMAVSGLPTTEFLLDVARTLSNAEIVDFKTRYNNEVASQYFRADIGEEFSKISNFPNLNKICEAGAKMYWDLELSTEDAILNFASIVNTNKIITLHSDFKIDQTMRVISERKFASAISVHRVIQIGGE